MGPWFCGEAGDGVSFIVSIDSKTHVIFCGAEGRGHSLTMYMWGRPISEKAAVRSAEKQPTAQMTWHGPFCRFEFVVVGKAANFSVSSVLNRKYGSR